MGRSEINHRRVELAVAGAGIATALTGGSALGAENNNQPRAIVTEGQMPSLNSGLIFEAKTAQLASEWINPVAIESAEEAARLFGQDSYSENPDNWSINEFGGATLNPDSRGYVHRVNTNGAVVEAWIKINKPGAHKAQTLVADPTEVDRLDINGGTFWKAPQGQAEELWVQVRKQVIAKEAIEQPDVTVVPVCTPGTGDPRDGRWINPINIPSAEYAAKTFGRDKYSKNPNNWTRHADGTATLNEDPKGIAHKVTFGNAVATVWNKVDTENGIDAVNGVATQLRRRGMYINSGTFYNATKADSYALFWQLLDQTIAREAKEQPGTLVLPYCN